jgi:demethylmenaquinone methyltransferase/2-methoxy-6-polyprenyl-1,4-benzoquinol methylase
VDVGCGTGDMAREVLRQEPGASVIACDFTPEMIAVGRRSRVHAKLNWVLADAQRLPFAAESFTGACSGFLLRNVSNVDTALHEQKRVLKPGGRMAALDTSPGQAPCIAPLQALHFKVVIPLLGWLLVRDASAYRYLSSSTRAFLSAAELAERLRKAGFKGVGFARRMFGSVAFHWGQKGK